MARAIAVEIVGDASSVERAFGKASVSAKKFDKSLGSSVRGATAGSGVFRGLGRSLAFASGGFLAFAGVSSTLRSAIEGAENLKKAQDALSVAVQHTGGDVTKLVPRYTAIAKSAQQFGVNQADATTALNRATVLTGDAAKAQRAYEEALVISKATGKDFNSVLTATAKGQEGITTSLQRYGIELKKGTPGQEQFNRVMARFQGQARANTSEIDRFRATWQNTEAILGNALLPTLNKILSRFSSWLTRMQRSGKLQRDVNRVTKDAGHIFNVLAGAVRAVDRATGSFKNTLELLLTLKLVSATSKWLGGLNALTGTAGGGGLRGSEVAAARLLTKLRALAGLGVITVEVLLFEHFIQKYGLKNTIHAGLNPTDSLGKDVASDQTITVNGKTYPIGTGAAYAALVKAGAHLPPIGRVTAAQEIRAAKALGGSSSIPASEVPHRHPRRHGGSGGTGAGGSGQPPATHPAHASAATSTTFSLPFKLQLAEAKASATKTLKDDLKVAREERAYILKQIRSHKLHGQKLIQAYQALAAANQTIADDMKSAAKKATKATKKATSDFVQANTRALTAGLDLTAAQRKALRARLSQLGPGGTVPNQGVGAYGYQINPHNDRPIVVHSHVHLKHKEIGSSVTTYQQRRRRRNPTQRRGPNAATSSA